MRMPSKRCWTSAKAADVTRLNADLMTSNDNADAIQAMLDTASGDVTRLNADLMTSNDNADAIQAMLDTASGDADPGSMPI